MACDGYADPTLDPAHDRNSPYRLDLQITVGQLISKVSPEFHVRDEKTHKEIIVAADLIPFDGLGDLCQRLFDPTNAIPHPSPKRREVGRS